MVKIVRTKILTLPYFNMIRPNTRPESDFFRRDQDKRIIYLFPSGLLGQHFERLTKGAHSAYTFMLRHFNYVVRKEVDKYLLLGYSVVFEIKDPEKTVHALIYFNRIVK